MFLFFLSLTPILTKWVIENPHNIVAAIGYDIVYLSVSFINMLMFHFVIDNSELPEISEMREARKKMASDDRFAKIRVQFMRRFLLNLGVIAVIISVSVIFKFSSYVLIGIPVVFSLINLISENPRHHADSPAV